MDGAGECPDDDGECEQQLQKLEEEVRFSGSKVGEVILKLGFGKGHIIIIIIHQPTIFISPSSILPQSIFICFFLSHLILKLHNINIIALFTEFFPLYIFSISIMNLSFLSFLLLLHLTTSDCIHDSYSSNVTKHFLNDLTYRRLLTNGEKGK